MYIVDIGAVLVVGVVIVDCSCGVRYNIGRNGWREGDRGMGGYICYCIVDMGAV